MISLGKIKQKKIWDYERSKERLSNTRERENEKNKQEYLTEPSIRACPISLIIAIFHSVIIIFITIHINNMKERERGEREGKEEERDYIPLLLPFSSTEVRLVSNIYSHRENRRIQSAR